MGSYRCLEIRREKRLEMRVQVPTAAKVEHRAFPHEIRLANSSSRLDPEAEKLVQVLTEQILAAMK